MEQHQTQTDTGSTNDDGNGAADAFAAVTLIVLFVALAVFWVAGQ